MLQQIIFKPNFSIEKYIFHKWGMMYRQPALRWSADHSVQLSFHFADRKWSRLLYDYLLKTQETNPFTQHIDFKWISYKLQAFAEMQQWLSDVSVKQWIDPAVSDVELHAAPSGAGRAVLFAILQLVNWKSSSSVNFCVEDIKSSILNFSTFVFVFRSYRPCEALECTEVVRTSTLHQEVYATFMRFHDMTWCETASSERQNVFAIFEFVCPECERFRDTFF